MKLPPRPKLRRNAKKNVNVENVTPIAQEAKLPKKVNNQIMTLAFTLALIMAVFGTIVAVALLYFVKKMR
jgi:heme/copper-type cytochrome/quinol oxidase subunit 2